MNKKIPIVAFLNEILSDIFSLKKNRSLSKDVLVKQILFTGYEAFPIIAIISLAMGALIIQQGYNYLSGLGQTDLIYQILVSLIIRDVGPLITSFIILARSGTAISTEIGNMVVNKEIDALKSMGISPVSYIVVPRVAGMVISLILLIIYFTMIGIFGGYLVSNMLDPLPFIEFVQQIIKAISIEDIITMIVKITFCGFAIASISSYHGLSVFRASTEVPQRNIKAVVHGVFAVFFINAASTIIFILIKSF